MLLGVLFFVAMLPYNVAVPVCYLGYDVLCSWLYFWGAAIFIAEAVVEIVYSRKFPPERLTQTAKRNITSFEGWFRAVNWELWSGVFFMIPSIFYLAETLVDPNIVGSRPAQMLRDVGIDDTSFVSICDWLGAWLFVVDALMRYCARWCIDRDTDASDMLLRFRVWTASSFHDMDWMFWGDIVFVVAAAMGVLNKFYTGIVLSAVSSGTWTFDAVLYLLAAASDWRSCSDDEASAAAEEVMV